MVEFKEEAEYNQHYIQRNVSGGDKPVDKGILIHPTFPSEGVINPSHLGSKSVSPVKDGRDSEEDLPQDVYTKAILNKIAQ